MTSLSPPVPSRLTVAGLDFEVQFSGARRSIGITVDRDGSLIVNAPHGCNEGELEAFAHEKRMWVYKKLAEKDLLLSHRPTKAFVSGEGFAYLGRSHRLQLTDRHGAPVKLERGRLVMLRDIVERGAGSTSLIDWYRSRALRWLPRRISPWALRMRYS
jgi:predicted metal-dependent hydrolase